MMEECNLFKPVSQCKPHLQSSCAIFPCNPLCDVRRIHKGPSLFCAIFGACVVRASVCVVVDLCEMRVGDGGFVGESCWLCKHQSNGRDSVVVSSRFKLARPLQWGNHLLLCNLHWRFHRNAIHFLLSAVRDSESVSSKLCNPDERPSPPNSPLCAHKSMRRHCSKQ